MPNLGTKYVCFSCQTKFYDLGRDVALCPKCGADQKDADASPAPTTKARRVVVEAPVEEPEVDETPERASDDDDDDLDDDSDSDDAGDKDDDDDEFD